MSTNFLFSILGLLILLVVVTLASGLRNGEDYYDLDVEAKQEMSEEWNRHPKACVTLSVYRDGGCSGDPVRKMSFSTWRKAGSPCCKYL